jgi:hypothetical protein
MPKPRRRLTTLALSLVAGLLLLPATGQAATVFGSPLKHGPDSGVCQTPGPCTVVTFTDPTEPNGDPYSGGAPVDGVITKFRIYANTATSAQVTFRLADINRPDPTDPSSALASAVGTGPTVTIQHTEEPEIHEFPGRLPVKKGEQLAIDATEIEANYSQGCDHCSYVFAPPLVDGSGAQGSLESSGQLLVQASIEPDADGDGFGDETQDQCPSQASTQGPCDVTAPVVSKLGVANGVVSYTLSEASTVSLQLEKKTAGRKVGGKCVPQTKKNRRHARCPRFKPIGARFSGGGNAGANQVTLPNGKHLRPGTYRVTITTTDAAGNTSTRSTTFKVKKKKRKH